MRNKPNKIIFIILTVVCFLLAGVILFIGFGVTAMDLSHYDEKHTHEYEVTFAKKEMDGAMWLIYVEEYDCAFVFERSAVANEENFNKLTKGDNLSFRSFFKIENVEDAELTKITIIALNSEGNDIVTFESSKSVQEQKAKKVKIVCIVFASLFIIVAILPILYCVGVIPIKKKI